MDPYKSKVPVRNQKSGAALFFLVLLGCGIVFFGIVAIVCCFVINFASDFQVDSGGGIEAVVQSRFTYSQYWAGIPFLFTGVLVICSGTYQRVRGLTITAVILCITSVFITFFVVSLDGNNWSFWNNMHRQKLYWGSKSGVECTTSSSTCECKQGTKLKERLSYECDEISELSSLYGAAVGSSILVGFFCLLSVLVITKSLSWKRIKYNHRSHYTDDFHVDNGRRTPSFTADLPYAKRGEYTEGPGLQTGPPYKQTVYQNYPY